MELVGFQPSVYIKLVTSTNCFPLSCFIVHLPRSLDRVLWYSRHFRSSKLHLRSQKVPQDIQTGMAGLKRDPTVILRIDGEDLREFINAPTFEVEMATRFSKMDLSNSSLRDCIIAALQKLGVEHGLPPASDSWVMSNILEPALQTFPGSGETQQPVSRETFIAEFKRVAEKVVEHLKEQPVIVAHTESIFDGSGIKRLLANKFELDKAVNNALETLPRDGQEKISKEHLHTVLVSLASQAGLPPYGAVEEMDKVRYNVFKEKAENDDGKAVKEEEFKKLLEEILGSIMVQLEENPISVSSSSVAHEALVSSASSS